MKWNNNIKTAIRVAKIELNSMFYSPVAWLVLVIFGFQIGMAFARVFGEQIRYQDMGYDLWQVTSAVFVGMKGILPPIQRYIYLYIPLITMGLMSREYQSGSIKLLYSSPVKNASIIMGKFLSMMIYGLALMAVLGVFVLFAAITVVNFDYPMILTGMLGLYLLILAYSAIGLFMSSITKYQVVAAIGTLAILAILNFIGGVGQEYDFVRNITYWLSITGRSDSFIEGLMASDDVLYFLIVIGFFLSLSILKLNTEKSIMSFKTKVMKYSAIVVVAIALGYVSSLSSMKYYYDATYTKSNTLSKESQEVLKNLEGDLKITTYVNLLDESFYYGLPRNRNKDFERFEKYFRFKPDIKMKYVYYYDKANNPSLEWRYPNKTDDERVDLLCKANRLDIKMFMTPDEIKEVIDLKPELNRFLRIVERENGQKAYLRMFNDNNKHPDEAEISAALKRFISPSPMVAFSTGYGSREMDNYGGRGFYLFAKDKWFRQSLLNNGFDTKTIDLDKDEIDDSIQVLVISDLREPLSDVAMNNVQKYIDRGGNLFILGEYNREVNMNKLVASLGVKFEEGVVVNKNEYTSPTVLVGFFTPEAAKKYPTYEKLQKYDYVVALPTTQAIDYSGVKDFEVTPVLVSDQDAWIEKETTDFVDGEFEYNPEAGEKKGVHAVLVTLSRKVGDKEQRIVISGDADVVANEALTSQFTGISASNYSIINGSFRWLSNEQFPVDTRRADYIDTSLRLPKGCRSWVNWGSMCVFPLLICMLGIVVIFRRKRK
ncbi:MULTISPECIES: Gldg family protein [Butyricimonas]|uniref:Gldg family protein n=1 Tax=Butyricimonas TaxID=574697 RepID=UPI001D06952D|nr:MULTISPECIES: Gldg family protein [Butyricimonas]MCB6971663.1 Gldg family protein [Butyricimonas synergistica]MCG4518730.1 Gldg family protein [Butyricimonas sp. DFI.6.44]